MQIDIGAVGLTCATLDEASCLVDHGFRDILIAYPVIVDEANREIMERLCCTNAITVGISSSAGAELLAGIRGKWPMKVAIEVEVGCERTGVRPPDITGLANLVQNLGLRLVGIFAYPGHGYFPGRSKQAAIDEVQVLSLAAESLRAAGFVNFYVSGGSTPTLNYSSVGIITEYRPGTYVFGDCEQLALGSMAKADVALTIESTVVEASPHRVVIDAGGKALGRDRPGWLLGYGTTLKGDSRIEKLFDHHGILQPIPGAKVGDRIQVIPNNANSAVNMHNYFWVDMQDKGGLLRWRLDSPTR
jgi:D-serine deaminase-like pyridoxal phosphate-dependent protein